VSRNPGGSQQRCIEFPQQPSSKYPPNSLSLLVRTIHAGIFKAYYIYSSVPIAMVVILSGSPLAATDRVRAVLVSTYVPVVGDGAHFELDSWLPDSGDDVRG
jgi:hypothetical protein